MSELADTIIRQGCWCTAMQKICYLSGRKLPTRLLCERFNVCDRTIARWQFDPKMGSSPIVTHGRKYFDENKIVQWERDQVSKS